MVVCLAAEQLQAQSYWEMTPYRVALYVAIEPEVRQGSSLAKELPNQIVERAENYVGAVWQLTAEPVNGSLAQRLLLRFDDLQTEDFAKLPEDLDKLLVLAIQSSTHGFHLRAREYDIRTQMWGPIVEQSAAHRSLLPDVAFDLLWQGFMPIAQVDVDADRNVILRPRAVGLPLRDPSLKLVREGDLFRPVIRKFDRKGQAADGGVQVLPWTFIAIEKVIGIQAIGKTQSGLRQSLGTRRRGQSEHLAIAVRPQNNSTRLKVVGRGKPPEPLPGYDVYAQIPGQKSVTLLARTNSLGEIIIPAIAESPIRILYIKGGGILLARLPMIPGLDATATAEVADDDVRLALEGYLASVRDNVVDLVARREILMARTRSRMAAGKLDDAEKFFDELRRLPTREQITLAINEQKTRNAASDPAVQAKIDRAIAETLKSLRRFLDPQPIDTLRTELNQAAKAPPPTPAAPAEQPAQPATDPATPATPGAAPATPAAAPAPAAATFNLPSQASSLRPVL